MGSTEANDNLWLEQAKMVRIFGLQRTDQNFKFGKISQILETGIFHKKRPARETRADAAFEPFEGRRGPTQDGQDAGNLIVGVVSVAKGFWDGAGARDAVHRLFGSSGHRKV